MYTAKPVLRDHSWETTCLWKTSYSWQKGLPTFQYNWTRLQGPPVLPEHIFMADGTVLQGRFYCITYMSVYSMTPLYKDHKLVAGVCGYFAYFIVSIYCVETWLHFTSSCIQVLGTKPASEFVFIIFSVNIHLLNDRHPSSSIQILFLKYKYRTPNCQWIPCIITLLT